jgi:hypothetical protein
MIVSFFYGRYVALSCPQASFPGTSFFIAFLCDVTLSQPAIWTSVASVGATPKQFPPVSSSPSAPLSPSHLSKAQLKGLMSACVVHFEETAWWKVEANVISAFRIVTSPKQVIQLRCGAHCPVVGADPRATSRLATAPPKDPEPPTVGVGRPTVHAVYQLERKKSPPSDQYVAEIVAFLFLAFEKDLPRPKLYALAQFHEVRLALTASSWVFFRTSQHAFRT